MPRMVLLEPVSDNMETDNPVFQRERLTVMFPGEFSTPSTYRMEAFQETVINWLRENEYEPDRDTFIMTGRMTKVAVALATIQSMFPDSSIKVAIWNGHQRKYDEKLLQPAHAFGSRRQGRHNG